MNTIHRLLKRVNKALTSGVKPHDFKKYRDDPFGYFRDILKIHLWEKQAEVVRKMLTPPYRVLLKSGHSCGKTFLMACVTCWFFDCRGPCVVITTAPTEREVCDLLWQEIRILRKRAGLSNFVGTVKPIMRKGVDYYAKGYTANKGESFVGRHRKRMLFIFDEAVAIESIFWKTGKTMFDPSGEHYWLAAFNPTDVSSQAYVEEHSYDVHGKPAWHVVQMSALEHPNIEAEMKGKPQPYPAAVSLAQIDDWVSAYCERVDINERQDGDFEWPVESGQWWRPGPQFESRAKGQWPSMATEGVWSDASWNIITSAKEWKSDISIMPVIGCDLATHGDDWCEMHVRWGTHSFHHERHNGWLEDKIAGRLKQLCAEYAAFYNQFIPDGAQPVLPEDIPVHYDGDGRGGALINFKGDYNFIPICASGNPLEPNNYDNRRSELWFGTPKLARAGGVNISRLGMEIREHLRRQCFAPKFTINAAGQLVVEPKKVTKKRLKASPDGADAMNLAYTPGRPFEAPSFLPQNRVNWQWGVNGKPVKRLFG